MRSQYIVFDIVIVGIAILIAVLSMTMFIPKFPNRYIINEEYYTLETLLMHRVNDEYIFEMIKYNELNSNVIESDLDKMVPKNYYYIFEIPEYKFRISNNKNLKSFNECVKLNKIYPIVEEFGRVHITFAIWDKNEKMEVVKCER